MFMDIFFVSFIHLFFNIYPAFFFLKLKYRTFSIIYMHLFPRFPNFLAMSSKILYVLWSVLISTSHLIQYMILLMQEDTILFKGTTTYLSSRFCPKVVKRENCSLIACLPYVRLTTFHLSQQLKDLLTITITNKSKQGGDCLSII
jgi:hypothetical protein